MDFQIGYRALTAPVVSSLCKLVNSKKIPVLVGLCGRSRAGKTTVAHAIVRVLMEQGIDCLHVRLDNWIVPAANREPNSSPEARNRVDIMPDLVRALRAGKCVRAPGYNAATRGPDCALTYDAAGKSVIVLDGIFAGHSSIRAMLDFVIFAATPPELNRARFFAFYRWKGFDEGAIEAIWRKRSIDEWSAVDAQGAAADFILTSGSGQP